MGFLLDMLETDHSNLQAKFGVHLSLKYFQNNQILKSDRIISTPFPTLKAYPTPRDVVG